MLGSLELYEQIGGTLGFFAGVGGTLSCSYWITTNDWLAQGLEGSGGGPFIVLMIAGLSSCALIPIGVGIGAFGAHLIVEQYSRVDTTSSINTARNCIDSISNLGGACCRLFSRKTDDQLADGSAVETTRLSDKYSGDNQILAL